MGAKSGETAGQGDELGQLQEVAHNESTMCGGIVMLQNHSWLMLVHKWVHVLLNYFVPASSTIEIAINEHKVSPVM